MSAKLLLVTILYPPPHFRHSLYYSRVGGCRGRADGDGRQRCEGTFRHLPIPRGEGLRSSKRVAWSGDGEGAWRAKHLLGVGLWRAGSWGPEGGGWTGFGAAPGCLVAFRTASSKSSIHLLFSRNREDWW